MQTEHLTEHSFAELITLGPRRLSLRPREGHDIRVVSNRLDITRHHEIKWHRDVHDNAVALVSFRDASRYLSIRSEVIIEHYEEPPLDFVVEDHAAVYPFQ